MTAFSERVEEFERRLARDETDAAIFGPGPNLYYLSGFAGETDRCLLLLLTDDGERLLGEGGLEFAVEPGDDSLTVDERLERLEKQVGRMRETYGEVKRRIVELEDEVKQHDDDLDDLARRLRNLITALEEAEEATNGS